MKKYVTEFVGTFFLVLTIALAVASGTQMAPLAIGAVLMVMVYMGGHVSGAHYNPAVSLALALRKAMPGSDLIPYVVAQLSGATAAATVGWIITGKTFAPHPGAAFEVGSAVAVEILFTLALVLVVMNVAITKATEGNSYYGLAIGFTIVAAAFVGGPISGGAFNPAVGLGPTIVDATIGEGDFSDVWIYLVGPLIGGVLGLGMYQLQHGSTGTESA